MHRRAQIGYRVRVVAYGYLLFVFGLHLLERNADAVAYGLLAMQCLAYPHLAYLSARRSADPRKAEIANQYLGTALLGLWTAALGFPSWIAYLTLSAGTMAGAITRGIPGIAFAIALYALGALAWVVPFGYRYEGATSALVTALCFLGALGFTNYVGFMAHHLRRDLKALSHLERRSRDRVMGPLDPGAGA